MLWLLKKAVERLKTLLVADAALDLEAQFLARQTDRQVELLHKADGYEEQGLHDLAAALRHQAMNLSIERPLATLLPTLGDLGAEPSEMDRPRLNDPPDKPERLTASNGTAGKTAKPKSARKKTQRR